MADGGGGSSPLLIFWVLSPGVKWGATQPAFGIWAPIASSPWQEGQPATAAGGALATTDMPWWCQALEGGDWYVQEGTCEDL